MQDYYRFGMLVYISLNVVYLFAYAFVQVFIVMCGEPTLALRSSWHELFQIEIMAMWF
jgi:hypothetical protein